MVHPRRPLLYLAEELFKDASALRQRLGDDELQRNLKRTRGRNAASRAAAVAAFPDAAEIFERNIETMEKLGHEGWKKLWLG